MNRLTKATISIVVSVFLAILAYKVSGADAKYFDTEAVWIPLAYAGGGIALYLLLWNMWVKKD